MMSEKEYRALMEQRARVLTKGGIKESLEELIFYLRPEK